jgi:hypothetical protein
METEFGELIKEEPEQALRSGKHKGRPPKLAEDRATKRIEFVCTQDEYERIQKLHKEHVQKMSLGGFILEVVLSQQGKGVSAKPTVRVNADNDRILIKIFQLLGQTNASLKGLTTLYNQSIKRINSLPASKKLMDEVIKNDPIIMEVSELLPGLKGTIDLLQKHLFPTGSTEPKTPQP